MQHAAHPTEDDVAALAYAEMRAQHGQPPSPRHVLYYSSHSGFGNRQRALRLALVYALVTDRTLVLDEHALTPLFPHIFALPFLAHSPRPGSRHVRLTDVYGRQSATQRCLADTLSFKACGLLGKEAVSFASIYDHWSYIWQSQEAIAALRTRFASACNHVYNRSAAPTTSNTTSLPPQRGRDTLALLPASARVPPTPYAASLLDAPGVAGCVERALLRLPTIASHAFFAAPQPILRRRVERFKAHVRWNAARLHVGVHLRGFVDVRGFVANTAVPPHVWDCIDAAVRRWVADHPGPDGVSAVRVPEDVLIFVAADMADARTQAAEKLAGTGRVVWFVPEAPAPTPRPRRLVDTWWPAEEEEERSAVANARPRRVLASNGSSTIVDNNRTGAQDANSSTTVLTVNRTGAQAANGTAIPAAVNRTGPPVAHVPTRFTHSSGLRNVDMLADVLADWWLLGEADVLLGSEGSSYSMTAASRRPGGIAYGPLPGRGSRQGPNGTAASTCRAPPQLRFDSWLPGPRR